MHLMKNLYKNIYWVFKEKYSGKWNHKILEDIRRLKNGEPVDYIIGWTPFINCKIDLSFKPLIPRPETEYWTEKIIKTRTDNNKNNKNHVLDIFSGSGCIGIAVLKNTKNTKVDFAEISPRLIKQIKLNLKINRISLSRYRVIQSDIFQNIRGRYNYILANPPYIPLKNKRKVQTEVLKYEPTEAIFGGQNGMLYIKKFLKDAGKYLATKGVIIMEFDSPEKNIIGKIAKTFYSNAKINFYKDQYNKWRFLKITL